MAESWLECVKRVYSENKAKPGYKLKDAMKDAKKQYKSPVMTKPTRTNRGSQKRKTKTNRK